MPTIFSEPYINSLLRSTDMYIQLNTSQQKHPPLEHLPIKQKANSPFPQNIFKVLSSHCSKWNWSLVARDIRIFSFLLNKNCKFFLICFASNKGSDFVFSRHPSQEPLVKIQQPVSLTNPGPPPLALPSLSTGDLNTLLLDSVSCGGAESGQASSLWPHTGYNPWTLNSLFQRWVFTTQKKIDLLWEF